MSRAPFQWVTLVCLLATATCTCHRTAPRDWGGFWEAETGGGREEPPYEDRGAVAEEPASEGPASPEARLDPDRLRYLGAFRLPAEFAWGARGLSYRPAGAGGEGTLLVTGFELPRRPDGTECTGRGACVALFGEVRIPRPGRARSWRQLPEARLVAPMRGFDGGRLWALSQYTWISDIEYVPWPGEPGGARLYGAVDLWYAEGERGEETFPTIFHSRLDGSDPRGLFHVGPERTPFHGRKMGAYLFTVPRWYADRYLGGRTLVTGRSRGTPIEGSEHVTTRGGSQGPTLFAFRPGPGGTEDALPILYYRVRYPACAGPNVGRGDQCDFPGFTMCDAWLGAAFVEGPSGRAILISGTKGHGGNCYDTPPTVCDDPCSEDHGYHCAPYEEQVIFYDVEELGRAALREVDPWSVLPYQVWRPRELLLGDQPCGTLGGMTFDPAARRLFVVERGLGSRDDNLAVVHVWQAD